MIKLSSFFFLAILTTLVLCTSVFAVEEKTDGKTIEQMMDSFKREKLQAESIIKIMAKRGRMTPEEVGHAKREIASVQEENLKDVKTEALEKIKTSQSFATK